MDCQHFDANMNKCPCTYEPCSRKGYCCQCLHYHLSINQLPACCFAADEERTYNRSISYFVQRRQAR